jgi:deoxyadenosine/deoxycytidine kinase
VSVPTLIVTGPVGVGKTTVADEMDAHPVEDMLVDTEDRDPPTIARDILLRAGWLPTHGG